jgi:anti-sigma regulatory factor (Ser/Thr protein kinase)
MPCSAPPASEHRFDIEVGARAPSIARRHVDDALRSSVPGETLEQVTLLVSELVTNVVRHARTGPGDSLLLAIRLGREKLRVQVSDRDPRPFDATPTPDPAQGRGYGLYLVSRLSRRWGVEHEGGTRVWFELGLAG